MRGGGEGGPRVFFQGGLSKGGLSRGRGRGSWRGGEEELSKGVVQGVFREFSKRFSRDCDPKRLFRVFSKKKSFFRVDQGVFQGVFQSVPGGGVQGRRGSRGFSRGFSGGCQEGFQGVVRGFSGRFRRFKVLKVSLCLGACNALSKENTWRHFWTELMQSRRVFGRSRVKIYHRSKRNNRAMKWYSESPLMRCLPIRQEILNVSQTAAAFHGIRPPFSSRPDRNSTAGVPSPFLRNALSAIPLVSNVLTYNDSRKGLRKICQIQETCQCGMTFGFLLDSKNFCKLFCVSCEVFVLHG